MPARMMSLYLNGTVPKLKGIIKSLFLSRHQNSAEGEGGKIRDLPYEERQKAEDVQPREEKDTGRPHCA